MCDIQRTNAEQNISTATCGQEKTKMDCGSIGSDASSSGFANTNTSCAESSCTGLGTIGLGSNKMISEVQTGSFSLTETMKREEEKLQQKTDRAEMKLEPERMKAFNEWSDEELREHRYKRLQHLLTKSNAYTGYLVERMKAQQEAERKREERQAQKLAREKEKAEKLEQERLQTEKNNSLASADNKDLHSTNTDELSESHRPPSPTVASCPPSSPKPPQSAHGSPSPTPKSASILSPTNASYTGRASRRQTRSSKALQNSQDGQVESGASQQSSQDSQRSPPVSKKRTRKRKAQTAKDIDNYKISDYLTEAISRNKRLKADKENERQEDDSTVAKSAATENDRVPPTSSIPEITQTTVLDSNQSQSSSKASENVVNNDGKMTANGQVVTHSQPDLFTGGVLRSYQLDGVRWLKVLYENGVNGILADEMGLGKTVQCIAVISYLIKQGIPGPFLVIAPLSTVPNWMSEFKRFAPKVPTMLYHGSKDERYLMRINMIKRCMIDGTLEAYPVVITSYVIVMNDKSYINNHPWKYIIVDEGHRMKNHNCRLVKELKTYNSTHRLLLTGTPLQNNLSELWSLLNFLLPEIFDDLSSFQAWFDVDYLESNNTHDEIVLEEQRKNILSMLHQILTPFMLRRLKTDVDLVIPPKREYLVYAPLTLKQKSVYESIIDKTIRYLIEEKPPGEMEEPELNEKGRPKRQSKIGMKYDLMMDPGTTGQKSLDDDIEEWAQAIVEIQEEKDAERSKSKKAPTSIINVQLRNSMMLLRRCCNHPYLIEYPLTKDGELKIDDDIVQSSGKFLLLDNMLRELKERGHKVLIFSQMTSMLDILQDFCYHRKYNYSRLDGSMKLSEREEEMDKFNSKDSNVFIFLLSTRAGGLGINLTAADTVIIFDSDWNPQSDLQAQDRCHRIGQDRPVVVYRLITLNTVDQRIVERAAAKRKLEKMVILKGKFKSGFDNFTLDLKYMDKNELLAVLKSRDYDDVFTGRGDVISKRDLDRLIDRSDLYDTWLDQIEKNSNGNVRKKAKVCEDVEGVFKVVQQSS